MSRLFVSVFLLCATPFVTAAALSGQHEDHHDISPSRLPSAWFHADDHPVHKLFKRAPTTDGITYADVGSPTWSSGFPRAAPDPSRLPQAWVDALQAAVSEGKIPGIPQTTNTPQTNPVYPRGTSPTDPNVCSATYKCRIPGDTWDAPDGHFGTGFDDGPQPASTRLNQFLRQNNERATHFMIGLNILNNPDLFLEAFAELENDIAVHTYTHPYMTTLSNEEIVGQLGWTMEIIHNSTGGRLPRYWRPPYGDYDMRVRAVAREVFGLEVILWNQDTADWSLTTGATTMGAINSSFHGWLTGPKSPGLIVLEHELSDQSVQAFINAYPDIKRNGWTMISQAEIPDGSVYQNEDDAGNVHPNLVGVPLTMESSTSSSSSPTSPTASSGSGSGASATSSTPQSGTPTGAASNGNSNNSNNSNGASSSTSQPLASLLVASLFFLIGIFSA